MWKKIEKGPTIEKLPCGIKINKTKGECCKTDCPFPLIRECDTTFEENEIEICYNWCKEGCPGEDPSFDLRTW